MKRVFKEDRSVWRDVGKTDLVWDVNVESIFLA